MFNEIDAELKSLEKMLFTGHIRFGIEHGTITTINLTSKVDNTNSQVDKWKDEILKQCETENHFFGSIEFNINFGRVSSFVYYYTIQGDNLKNRIQKCKSVKYVVKALNT